MAYLTAIMGTVVFVIFMCFSTMVLNGAIKKTQEFRYGKTTVKKIKHSIYTACYSFVFSIMLIVSVYFPFFLVGTCGNFSNVQISNPLIDVRNSIIKETEQSYQQPFNSNFNVFNEINKTVERFNNDDIWD